MPSSSPTPTTISPPDAGIVALAVRDRGAGLATARRSSLFERQPAADGQNAGLGLGLYVSRQIVERHGGELVAEFPASGGARFVMHLPAGDASPAEHAAAD